MNTVWWTRSPRMQKAVVITVLLCSFSLLGVAQTTASFTSASLSEYQCVPAAWDPGADSSEVTASVRESGERIDVKGRPVHADLLRRGQEDGYSLRTSVETESIDGVEGLVFNIDILNRNLSGSDVYCRALFDGVVEGADEDFSGRTPVEIRVRSNDTETSSFVHERTWTVQVELPGSSDPDDGGDGDGPPGGGDGNGGGSGGGGSTIDPPGDISQSSPSFFEKLTSSPTAITKLIITSYGLWRSADAVTNTDLEVMGVDPFEESDMEQAFRTYDKVTTGSWFVDRSEDDSNNLQTFTSTFTDTVGTLNTAIELIVGAIPGIGSYDGSDQQIDQYTQYAEDVNRGYQEGTDFAADAAVRQHNGKCGFGGVLGSTLIAEFSGIDYDEYGGGAGAVAQALENPTQCVNPNRFCNEVKQEGQWIWDAAEQTCVRESETADAASCGRTSGTSFDQSFSQPGAFWNSRTGRCTHWSVEPCSPGQAIRVEGGTVSTASCVDVNAEQCSGSETWMWTAEGGECMAEVGGSEVTCRSNTDSRTTAVEDGSGFACTHPYSFPDCPEGYRYDGESCVVG